MCLITRLHYNVWSFRGDASQHLFTLTYPNLTYHCLSVCVCACARAPLVNVRVRVCTCGRGGDGGGGGGGGDGSVCMRYFLWCV